MPQITTHLGQVLQFSTTTEQAIIAAHKEIREEIQDLKGVQGRIVEIEKEIAEVEQLLISYKNNYSPFENKGTRDKFSEKVMVLETEILRELNALYKVAKNADELGNHIQSLIQRAKTAIETVDIQFRDFKFEW